jgi:hypothetical protein
MPPQFSTITLLGDVWSDLSNATALVGRTVTVTGMGGDMIAQGSTEDSEGTFSVTLPALGTYVVNVAGPNGDESDGKAYTIRMSTLFGIMYGEGGDPSVVVSGHPGLTVTADSLFIDLAVLTGNGG